jgi:hypothetical protein
VIGIPLHINIDKERKKVTREKRWLEAIEPEERLLEAIGTLYELDFLRIDQFLELHDAVE